jgi:hypothetical protein
VVSFAVLRVIPWETAPVYVEKEVDWVLGPVWKQMLKNILLNVLA